MKREATFVQSSPSPCGRGLGGEGRATPSQPPPSLWALLRPLLFGAALALAACATSDAPPAPIPPPLAEAMPNPPVSPVPEMWQPGHWDWTGSAYVWVPGQYVEATGHGGTWMPGWWEKTDSGWVWHSGHWL